MTTKPTAKSIINSINKIKIKFLSDIPDHEVKEGDVVEFPENEAKKIVKNGIAVFYDVEKQKSYDEEEASMFLRDAFLDKKEMAKHFIDMQPTFYDRSGLFWMWNRHEFKWEIIDDIDLMNKIDSKNPKFDTIKSKEKQEILEAIKRVGREMMPLPAKKTWVQFKDIIVDVNGGDQIEASNKYYVTNPIPWKIGKSKDTPTMDRIFEEWVGKDRVQTLYEILAYCTLPDYPIHRIFCFVGAGLNGKSKFLELISRFVGKDNVSNTELDTLLGSRFEMAKIYKKLVCMMGETDYSTITKTSLIKKLTGQDQIGYEFKNKNPFDDYNYAKLLIATNGLPMTEDKSIGFYRRWLIIDFPNVFSEKKDVLEDVPDEEYENLAKKSIATLKHLFEVREFHKEGNLKEREERYEDISNPLQKFIDQFVKRDVYGKIYKWELRAAFVSWMIKRGYREWSEKEITIEMRSMGFEDKRDSDGERWRYWCGIILTKSVQGVQGVQLHPTQNTHRESKLNGVDTLDKLDGWKNSGDNKSEVTIGFLKNTYKITESELSDYKEKGVVLEVTPGKFRLV